MVFTSVMKNALDSFVSTFPLLKLVATDEEKRGEENGINQLLHGSITTIYIRIIDGCVLAIWTHGFLVWQLMVLSLFRLDFPTACNIVGRCPIVTPTRFQLQKVLSVFCFDVQREIIDVLEVLHLFI